VILAGILLKMGTYGFIRFAVPLFPDVAFNPVVSNVVLTLAVIGVVYGALVAMVQPDFKRLVAYSSVSHLGFVMLGLWAATLQSVQGAMLVMINHGISTGALFLLIGMVYERRHSRMIADFGGIAAVMPAFAAVLTFVSLSSIGLPGTNGFVGEFLVLLGTFQTHPLAAAISTLAVIIAAAYLLWALKRILYGRITRDENRSLRDLTPREYTVLVPLLVLILWLGLYPQPVLRRLEPAARAYVDVVRQHRMLSEDVPGEGH
jgi:NADH-quinone oxidoreductase subunit M